jgi:zinc transporter ZupT
MKYFATIIAVLTLAYALLIVWLISIFGHPIAIIIYLFIAACIIIAIVEDVIKQIKNLRK